MKANREISTHPPPRRKKITLAAFGIALIAAVYVAITSTRYQSVPEREWTRDRLELRDGILCEKDTGRPFDGTLVEFYPGHILKHSIPFRAGKTDGLSKGYYQNGQPEVEEHFLAGLSHGKRTRWYESGQLKSEATIVAGKIEGTFTRWHPNGRKAAEVRMAGGEPNGLSEAWHESGARKSRAEIDHGKVVSQQHWEDDDA